MVSQRLFAAIRGHGDEALKKGMADRKRTKRDRVVRKLLDAAVDELLPEIEGKTLMEIRLIFERAGVVDLLMVLRDLRSTAVSRYLGQRRRAGKQVFRRVVESDEQGRPRYVWRVTGPCYERGEEPDGDKETENPSESSK